MKFLSLFSGIGGLDLGLERSGMTCIGQVEIDPFCQKILAKHWPNVPRHDDIKTFTKDTFRELPELICGGFPCQDLSLAGKREGINGSRSGLWTEFFRIICEIRPKYVLVENVPGMLVPDKRTRQPAAISRVLGDLAEIGMDAEWCVLWASDFGSDHARPRVFIIAYTDANREQGSRSSFDARFFGSWRKGHKKDMQITWWRDRPILGDSDESLLCRRSDGIPDWMDRIGSLGNAVVPQVAEYVGRLILDFSSNIG